jgi:hypothetical protein
MTGNGMYAESDTEFSAVVTERYQCRCAWPRCGDLYGLGVHHIVPRALHALRWFIPNGVLLCGAHHDLMESSKNTPRYDLYMKLLIGQRRYDSLLSMRDEARAELSDVPVPEDATSEVGF